MDHLVNPDKYTKAQLKANDAGAWAAYVDGIDDDAVHWVAYAAAYYSTSGATDDASYWVDEYFDITSEDKQTYIDKLGE